MQQITRSIYMVQDGEQITVEVEAVKVGNFVSFVLDGKSLEPVSSSPITYQFPVTVGPESSHFGMVGCHFPTSAPSDAEYDIFVSGNMGGVRFTGSNVVKTDPVWDRSIEFRR